MGVLNIEDIEEGMELAGDLVNFNGRVLLKAGSLLTERHLGALKAWGISEANIVGVDRNSTAELRMADIDPEVDGRIAREMAYSFKKTDLQNPVVAEIYRLVKKRRLRDFTHE